MKIRDWRGESPITLRTLNEIAEREGWDLDTRLTLVDDETYAELPVRGVMCVPGNFGPDDMCIVFDSLHEDDWEVASEEVSA